MKFCLIAFLLSAITSRVTAETKLTLLHGRLIYFVILICVLPPIHLLGSHCFCLRFTLKSQ